MYENKPILYETVIFSVCKKYLCTKVYTKDDSAGDFDFSLDNYSMMLHINTSICKNTFFKS